MLWWFWLILHVLGAAANSSRHKFSTPPQYFMCDSSVVCPQLPQNRNNHLPKLATFEQKQVNNEKSDGNFRNCVKLEER